MNRDPRLSRETIAAADRAIAGDVRASELIARIEDALQRYEFHNIEGVIAMKEGKVGGVGLHLRYRESAWRDVSRLRELLLAKEWAL